MSRGATTCAERLTLAVAPRLKLFVIRVPGVETPGYRISPLRGWKLVPEERYVKAWDFSPRLGRINHR